MLLTVDQIVEAAFELSREDRMWILERITEKSRSKWAKSRKKLLKAPTCKNAERWTKETK